MRVNVGSYGEDVAVTYDPAVQFGPPEAASAASPSTSFWDDVASALRPALTASGQALATSIYSPRPGQPGYVPPPKAPVTLSGSIGGVSPNLLILGGVGLLAVLFLLRRK